MYTWPSSFGGAGSAGVGGGGADGGARGLRGTSFGSWRLEVAGSGGDADGTSGCVIVPCNCVGPGLYRIACV
jgi:hypothetical protein